MNCRNLILITGESCQGKTYIAITLKERCGFYTIHTDNFYSPYWDPPVKSAVGEEDEQKTKLLQEYKKHLTETTVIEGSHIGNRKELEIFVRDLEFDGEIYAFKAECSNEEIKRKAYEEKYGKGNEHIWKSNAEWFRKIYNLKEAIVVESPEEVLNFLEIHDGNICIPRQG